MEGAPSIADWPEEDRPRERLYHKGAEALADAELVAIQLGAGVRGTNAVELAREMLVRYGSLSGLAGRDVAELAGIRGVGRAKAVRLASAFELTRQLVECGRLLDLRIHDHVVIGRGRFASLAERGAL